MQVQVCTHDCAFAVLEKAQHLVAECVLEQDPTASRYFVQIASIYKSLVENYYMYAEEDFVPVSAITDAIVEHLVYYDDSSIYTDLVANTDLESIDLYDLTCLSS
jgi:hypothetical protein